MLKKMIISSLAIIFLTMQIGVQIQAQQDTTFKDVPKTHWASASIDAAVKKGYVTGYPDGSFKPEKTVTRAEFVKMAVEALGIDTTSTVKSLWYIPYTEAAIKAGILKDTYTANQFNDALPRNEMAKVAVLGSGTPGYENRVATTGDPLYPNYSYEVASFDEAMYVATKVGLVQGTGAGKVDATGSTTRAQAITIIERMLTVKNGGKLTAADELTINNAEFAWHKTNMYTVMGIEAQHVNVGFGTNGFIMEDSKYKGELVKLTVIDLSKKDSVMYKKQKNLKDIKWMYNLNRNQYSILDYPNSYLFIYETKLHKNTYSNLGNPVVVSGNGAESLDIQKQALEGKLTGKSIAYDMSLKEPDKSSTIYRIIPKSRLGAVEKDTYLSILLTYNNTDGVSLQHKIFELNQTTYKAI